MVDFCRSEVNIKPWESLLKELREGNQRSTWINREPYAYWKGNPSVAETRQDLMKCNVSEEHEWNARVYAQVVMMMHFEKYGIFEKIPKTLILLVTTAILIYVCVFCFVLILVGLDPRIKGRLQAIRLGESMPSQVEYIF